MSTIVDKVKPWIPPLFAAGVVAVARLISLPGLENRLAWATFDNSVFYAYRFADSTLFPNDLYGKFAHAIYPFVSIVHLIPAVLWRFAHIDPVPVAYVEVFLTDLILALAMYAFSQALFSRASVSLLAAMLGLSARVTNWNLANYGYIGNQLPYPGDMIAPFLLLVLALLVKRRTKWAILMAGALSLIHSAQAAYMVAIVGVYLLLSRREHNWRAFSPWILVGLGLFALGLLPGAYLGTLYIKDPLSREEWLKLIRLNQHVIPWLSWWNWQWFIPFAKWALLWALCGGALARLEIKARHVLYAVWVTTLLLCVSATVFIWLQIPVLMQLGFFRVTVLFNLVALPLVAAYGVNRAQSGSVRGGVLAAAVVLAVGLFQQPPSWWLLIALAADSLSEGRLAFWQVPLPAIPRRALAGLGWLMLLVAVAGVGLAFWNPLGGKWEVLRGVLAGLIGKDMLAGPMTGAWILSSALILIGLHLTAWRLPQGRAFIFSAVLILSLVRPILDEASEIGATQQKASYRAWKATQDWARQNTPLTATFIGFPLGSSAYPQEWRTFSQRNLVDLAYRGFSVYLPDKALVDYDKRAITLFGLDPESIVSRVHLVNQVQMYYAAFRDPDFVRIAQATGANYAIILKPRTLGFAVAYENPFFTVYDLTRPTNAETEFPLEIPNGDFEEPANDGRVLQWGVQNADLSISHQPYSGQRAALIRFKNPRQAGWFYSGDGDMLTPPREMAFQIKSRGLYRILGQMRGENCPKAEFFVVEFDQTGKTQLTSAGQQYFLTYPYIVNPHLYVPQVAFFVPKPTTVSFRFAVRYVDEQSQAKPCELEVDQVQMSLFRTPLDK